MEIIKIDKEKEVIDVGDFLFDECDNALFMVTKNSGAYNVIDMRDGTLFKQFLTLDSLRNKFDDYILIKNKDISIQIPYY